MKLFSILALTIAGSLGGIEGFVLSSSPATSIHTLHGTPSTLLRATDAAASAGSDSDSFAASCLSAANALRTLSGSIIVVKYGGNAMTSPELSRLFGEDIAALQSFGCRVVVVHGGGPMINGMLERVGVESRFEGGMRVSTPEVVEVASMVLCGTVNKDVAQGICDAGGRALGLSGRDDGLLRCTKLMGSVDGQEVDIGNVGAVESVNTDLIRSLLDAGIAPVVAPIGTGVKGAEDERTVYNVNADVAAGRIAGELKAAKVLFLTDIAGVLDKSMELLPRLSCEEVDALIEDETVTGGMIPKVTYATDAVKLGVGSALIADGRVPHALLNELLGGDGNGTGGGTTVTL